VPPSAGARRDVVRRDGSSDVLSGGPAPLANIQGPRSHRPPPARSLRRRPGPHGGYRMNEELDSQLSAMFDNELPAAECELLARRLSRDEQLQARWGRYAIVGAVIRAERGVRLNAEVARRGSGVLRSGPAPAASAAAGGNPLRRGGRWWQPPART